MTVTRRVGQAANVVCMSVLLLEQVPILMTSSGGAEPSNQRTQTYVPAGIECDRCRRSSHPLSRQWPREVCSLLHHPASHTPARSSSLPRKTSDNFKFITCPCNLEPCPALHTSPANCPTVPCSSHSPNLKSIHALTFCPRSLCLPVLSLPARAALVVEFA